MKMIGKFTWFVVFFVLAQTALARTVNVGSGCTYGTLQAAIDSLGSSPNTEHIIRLRTGTISDPNGINMNLPADIIHITGGYANCLDLNPTDGQVSTLDASGGDDGTVMTINAGGRNLQQNISFENVVVTGGNSETGPLANPEGGGLEIRGHVRVTLKGRSWVQNNSTGKGGGVYLSGDGSTKLAELFIENGATITTNVSSNLGGGVYCHDNGLVHLRNGSITLNDADNGGGIYLRNRCGLRTTGDPGGFKNISNNRALSGDGGGIYLDSDGSLIDPIRMAGSQSSLMLMAYNTAQISGGHLFAQNSNASVQLLNTFQHIVFLGGQAQSAGAIFAQGLMDISFGFGLAGSPCSFFGNPGCIAFYDNVASFGAGVIETRGTTNDAPILKLTGVHFSGNRGAPAIVSLFAGTISMEGSVVRDNTATSSSFLPSSGTLFYLHGDAAQSIRYSSILDNTTDHVITSLAGNGSPGFPLSLTGNIIWTPGANVWRNWDNGPTTVVHDACLIATSAAGLPGGVITNNPNLEANFTPGTQSPALDVCDNIGGAPGRDFNNNERGYDQLQIPDTRGPNDLGAVERQTPVPPQVNLIFEDSFETP